MELKSSNGVWLVCYTFSVFSFFQVSHNFSEIFKLLVNGGKAQLIMKRETKDSEEESSSSQQSSQVTSSQRSAKTFDEFSGISIKVSGK